MSTTFAPNDSQDSFADLLTTIIMSVKGKLKDGSAYWAYLAMKPSMVKPLKDAQATGNFDLEDYGTVIEWGAGEAPPAEVLERMRKDYALESDYEAKHHERLDHLG